IQMIILGRPNNPTGNACDAITLQKLTAACQFRKIFLVVDEAFIDFWDTRQSALIVTKDHPYRVIVRSMTKFYGLAGIRLGFGVMHPGIRRCLEKYQIPWSVNAVAQSAGVASLADREYFVDTRKWAREQRRYLESEMTAVSAFQVFPSKVNFLLFRLLDDAAGLPFKLFSHLIHKKILIRNCGNFRGLDERYFRVAVRNFDDNRRLMNAIRSFFVPGE
ncbi:MAG: aminotransferase class I/II-fold pyridoxal phosphate-dependent enzyme, partial [Nitrospinaceae bacterium]|nr:aminotransferase class I/II-fold pyridoxal phosphate-dependent enzyme [Nitrospinaceae bacterium]NIR55236.1 aminotransferase class I/II-fold pyridoxal phosphate-dependent enzyme [Nitrospinaceae bacterium]NIS85670.1 aminotransferase class I/II-fold pyridoxal phosphate-dependent enzyme [Nitrospinaceae bacterium]NIT82515.1 aminotransferase class I/II-fold pyridoxal phosphate-dependent enzyme [Nitrospinaceae bacterium]NIU44720.1 aminotransferase class I/II-fold pyridoxal phosphate-dependent enzym